MNALEAYFRFFGVPVGASLILTPWILGVVHILSAIGGHP
jgi:hypothetical protein